MKVIPVILCGGVGTRLWPLSRRQYPKQFLPLFDKQSLFNLTLSRIKRLQDLTVDRLTLLSPIIITNENHRFLVSSALNDMDMQADIILEPMGKNTAISLTLAALYAKENYRDCVLVVLPADHFFDDNEKFIDAVLQSVIKAENDAFSIIGIKSKDANTAYGYIKANSNQVMQFIEKPSKKDAEIYVQKGYFWNMGIVCTKASYWLSAIDFYQPQIYELSVLAWQDKKVDNLFIRPCEQEFLDIPEVSIDYAVLEKCPKDNKFVICFNEYQGMWSDLGSWDAILQMLGDDDGNAFLAQTMSYDTKNSLTYSDKPVVMLGVDDVMLIDTPDVLLLCHQSKAQFVKNIMDDLQKTHANLLENHRKVYRPWGWYDSIETSERFKVKRICVNPKASLSLQKHYHRSEHWVVVKGTALVNCDNQEMLVGENQSVYIPLGAIHRLSNPGIIPLEMIEVQSGSYLEEDDIVRFDDVYGR